MELNGDGSSPEGLPAAPAPPGSRFRVLFLRRKPRMFGATYGPIRQDTGYLTLHRDYLELEGRGVRYEGWRAARVIILAVLFGGGPIGALVAYFWLEYAATRPMRVIVPLSSIRRVVLDPIRGTVMVGAEVGEGRPTVWHSFATAHAWAIFDGLERLLESGICGLVTSSDRALARGDLAVFLTVCALVPMVGVVFALMGLAVGLSAAFMGQRRTGFAVAASCLLLLGAHALFLWWYFFRG